MKQILGAIQNISTKKLLPTQVSKLAIFIQIWLLRITNKHEIEHTLSQEPAELDQIRQVVGPDIPHLLEQQYLYLPFAMEIEKERLLNVAYPSPK